MLKLLRDIFIVSRVLSLYDGILVYFIFLLRGTFLGCRWVWGTGCFVICSFGIVLMMYCNVFIVVSVECGIGNAS
jgi:hypothetical protein